jgi:hypothetical protein
VTDRPPDSDHSPRPAEVRRSLRALADGSVPPRESAARQGTSDAAASPKSVVADAECAVDCACEAAAFLSGDRLPDLDRAVATAVRRGDDGVAGRGRAARESLRRLDAALNGSGATETPTEADPDPREDHFHSGRGTVLGDTVQVRDR